MLMPPTSVDEDRLLPGRENQVRLPRQLTHMKSVTIPEPMEKPPDDHLRPGILAPDLRHQGAARLMPYSIHGRSTNR
jgi:hypothetical protein